MKNLSIFNKIMVIASLTLLLPLIGFFGIGLPLILDETEESQKENLRIPVLQLSAVLDQLVSQVRSGTITDEEAKRQATQIINNFRYRQSYVFVTDQDMNMVIHPAQPSLVGKNLSNLKDENGVRIVADLTRMARNEGEGFLYYMWNKPGIDGLHEKLSYGRYFAPWGWTLTYGVYTADTPDAAIIDSLTWLGVVIGLLSVAAMGFAVFNAFQVSRPLRKVLDVVTSIDRGQLDKRTEIESQDEVGQVAKAVDRLAANLQDDVLAAFSRLSSGDFTFEARGVIRDYLRQTNQSLTQIIRNIQHHSEEFNSSAVSLLQSSQQLEQASTTQAASLEEISASMREISEQAQQNSDYSSEADELATDAQRKAEQGQQQMNQMVEAVHEIQNNSENISRIIKTIEEIAFQTNVLAINASVEAARAGEHGKGFAVVAEEVRALAQHSAQAAHEITELVQKSVSSIERGVKLSDETSDQLRTIVEGMEKVGSVVRNISEASGQQAKGAEEIYLGLKQLNDGIQQTQFGVGQTTMASNTLKEQADFMSHQVRQFHILSEQDNFTGTNLLPN